LSITYGTISSGSGANKITYSTLATGAVKFAVTGSTRQDVQFHKAISWLQRLHILIPLLLQQLLAAQDQQVIWLVLQMPVPLQNMYGPSPTIRLLHVARQAVLYTQRELRAQ